MNIPYYLKMVNQGVGGGNFLCFRLAAVSFQSAAWPRRHVSRWLWWPMSQTNMIQIQLHTGYTDDDDNTDSGLAGHSNIAYGVETVSSVAWVDGRRYGTWLDRSIRWEMELWDLTRNGMEKNGRQRGWW